MKKEVLDVFRQGSRFVITSHVRPDGDAIGSELALARFLRKLGKTATVINSDPLPYNLFWLPGADEIVVYDGSIRQREAIADADAVLIVDTNALERIGRLSGAIQNARGAKVLIDHHTNPERWFDVVYVRDTASSTAELMYELIAAYDPELLDTEMATCLYTAMMTDTGSFRYSSVNPQVHRIVADLLERGDIEPAPIHIAVYDTRTLEGLRLLGLALESITLCYGGQLGYMVVSQRMVRESSSSLEETEGFVNYALSIEGVRAALLFSETESGTKVSFRSKGDTYVNEWARSFGGGGHRNASGAYVRRPLEAVVDEVVAAAARYLGLNEAEEETPLSAEDQSYLSSLMDLKSQQSSS